MILRREAGLKAFLAMVWLMCFYRAVTQSIVHDEALTYRLYIDAPLSRIFQFFDANHHFLNTLLMRLSVSILGVSEWSLRLPALGGAALYLSAVYRIAAREFRSKPASLLAVALLTLNPFILDFMVAARGYGMALGFWMWALAILAGYVGKPEATGTRTLLAAGCALFLSIMANLVFVVPAVVLTAAAWAMLRTADFPVAAAPPRPAKKRRKKRLRPAVSARDRALQEFWRWAVIPFLCGCALFFLVSPLAQASSGDFYAGAETLAESLRSLYDASLAHGGPLRHAALSTLWRDAVTFGVAPAILLAGIISGIRRHSVLIILGSGTAIACAVVLLMLHVAVNLRYPLDRTGIYFLPLVSLALAGLSEGMAGRGPERTAGTIACVLSTLLVAQFLLEIDTRKFAVWEYDADTRTLLKDLARVVPDKRPGAVRLANSWQLEPSLSFYARQDDLAWLQPILRAPISPGADYYILIPMDRGAMESVHLRALYTGPNSGTILAASPAR